MTAEREGRPAGPGRKATLDARDTEAASRDAEAAGRDGKTAGRDRTVALLAAASLAAVALALTALHLVGLPGVDAAAHAYKTGLVARRESLLWDDLWYGGSYGVVGYGVVYYLLAAAVGAVPVVLLSAGLLPPLFHLYVRRSWGVRSVLPAASLVAVTVAYLLNGQSPFLLAMALTLLGLVLLASGRPLGAALPIGLAAFTNPVAVVAGAVFLAAEAIARPAARRPLVRLAAGLVPFAVLWAGVQLAFRARTWYLAQPAELLKWTAVAVAGLVLAHLSRGPQRRTARAVFAVAAAVCLAAIVVPAELGNNAARFLALFALPVALTARPSRLPKAVTAALLAAVAVVQLAAPVTDLARAGDRAQTSRAFFAPALAFATRRPSPDFRCHVVALRLHWEAAYFPEAGIAITRGWFRQDDWLHNEVLYRHPTPAAYVAWLRACGVRDVFVPHAALDTSSGDEPGLIARSGAFVRVFESGGWTVYRLRSPSPLVVDAAGGAAGVGAPATPASVGAALVAMTQTTASVAVSRPGTYLVKLSWTPYWRLEAPAGAGAAAALARGPGGWTLLRAPRPGDYALRIRFSLRTALGRVF